MKTLLTILLLAISTTTFGQIKILTRDKTVIFPDRRAELGSPYFAIRPTIPVSIWTNSVLWITAESPIFNEGNSNAQWICYAKNCVTNGTQIVLTNQPSRVYTNGTWVFLNDQVSDCISNAAPPLANKTVVARLWFPLFTTNNLDCISLGGSSAGVELYTADNVQSRISGTIMRLSGRFGSTNGLSPAVDTSDITITQYFTGTFRKVCYSLTASNIVLAIDGTNIWNSTFAGRLRGTNSTPYIDRSYIGGGGNSTRTPQLVYWYMLNYSVDTNTCAALSAGY